MMANKPGKGYLEPASIFQSKDDGTVTSNIDQNVVWLYDELLKMVKYRVDAIEQIAIIVDGSRKNCDIKHYRVAANKLRVMHNEIIDIRDNDTCVIDDDRKVTMANHFYCKCDNIYIDITNNYNYTLDERIEVNKILYKGTK